MDLQLKGHRAIVTGSSAGIGEAIARKLAAEGAAVASPLAGHINGANLRIDGGSTAVV